MGIVKLYGDMIFNNDTMLGISVFYFVMKKIDFFITNAYNSLRKERDRNGTGSKRKFPYGCRA